MKLVAFDQRFKRAVDDYLLRDARFTGLPQEAIAVSATNPEYHSILLVTDQGDVPTFLVLDFGKDKLRYTGDADSLLLRSFSTDDRFVRQGYALAALRLLPSYINDAFPAIHELVLGVNEKNLSAQRLYEKAGFEKRQGTYQGKKGTQFIYRRAV